ncbi:MAG TPA: hypothetical protein VF942_01570 [Acidimicrobiales bacterium]
MRFTRPYMASGYVLVVPARSTKIRQLEDMKDGVVRQPARHPRRGLG